MRGRAQIVLRESAYCAQPHHWGEKMKNLRLLLFTFATFALGPAVAGNAILTGPVPLWHSKFGPNVAGENNLAKTGIDFARNSSALPFLFVESLTVPVPSGNAHTAPFLTS